MTYTILGGAPFTTFTKLNSTSPIVVQDSGQSGVIITEINATEIGGGTPALTLERYNGTTSTYFRYQKAMTAKEEYQRQSIIVLKTGESLRATASAANVIDVIVTYIPRDATAKGGAVG